MTTPLKALIQERLRAKIVRQGIDDDALGSGDVDDFASLDRDLDLQSPSRLLARQHARGARRGSVDARPSNVRVRTQQQQQQQQRSSQADHHIIADATSRHRRHTKHHASNAGHRQHQDCHHNHDERRRRHQHDHGRRNSSHHSDQEEEQQLLEQQSDAAASNKLLGYFTYDQQQQQQQFSDYARQSCGFGSEGGARYRDEPFGVLHREVNGDDVEQRHVRVPSPWERHEDASYSHRHQHVERRVHSGASDTERHIQQHERSGKTRAERLTNFLSLPSPRAFPGVNNDMQRGLLGDTALIPAEAYEVGFPTFETERFDYANARTEYQTQTQATRSSAGNMHTASRCKISDADCASEREPRKREFAAHASSAVDKDIYERRQRQRHVRQAQGRDDATDQTTHSEFRFSSQDTHGRPVPQRFESSVPLHLDMAASPLAAASSLAPLVFAAATSPRLETNGRGASRQQLSQRFSYAPSSNNLPAPLDMAAVESSDDSESSDVIGAARALSSASELLSRRPAGPMVRRLNSKMLSPGCHRAATAFVEKRRKRTTNSTPRTMATQRWLQSMGPPSLPTTTSSSTTSKSARGPHVSSFHTRAPMHVATQQQALDVRRASPDTSSVTL